MTERLGEFELLEILGEGGSAVVYAARRGEQEVALKVARETTTERARERFLAEAERLARIGHPNVVAILGSGTLPDGRAFLAMRRLHGESLAARLGRGPLSLDGALSIFDALADGVSAIHEAGLVHRDIKPENVFLQESGVPVLLDLGIAREVSSGPSTTTLDGAVHGTPSTMAPERFFGSSASERTDVYELALLLYAMIAGRLPWSDAHDPESRLCATSLDELGLPLPRALSDEIMRALSTRPERRPKSVRELRTAIERARADTVAARRTEDLPLRDGDAPASAPSRTETSGRSQRGRTVGWVVAVASAALAIPVLMIARRPPSGASAGAMANASATASADASVAATTNAGAIASTSADTEASGSASASSPHELAAAPPLASTAAPALAPSRAPTSSPASASASLAWCKKLADVQCNKDFIAYSTGASVCEAARKNLALFESQPSSMWPAYEKVCRESYPTVEKHVADALAHVMHPPAALVPSSGPATAPASMPQCTQLKDIYCDPEVVAMKGGALLCKGANDSLALYRKQPPEWRAVDEERCRAGLPAARQHAAQTKKSGIKDADP